MKGAATSMIKTDGFGNLLLLYRTGEIYFDHPFENQNRGDYQVINFSLFHVSSTSDK